MNAAARVALVLGAMLALAATAAAARDDDPFAAAIARYDAIAARGGWPPLPAGRLTAGARGPAVAALRARLTASGDLASGGRGDVYDGTLADGVRAFQRRHGLHADGVVGEATRRALDVPIDRRIAQLELARAEARAPRPAGRWIRVNVPRFWLQVLDGSEIVLEMPVVVGRPSRPTPLFQKDLAAVVVNPPWTVPEDLAYHDMLPKIVADPRYLAQRRIDVFESWEPGAPRLDPSRIDWKRLGRGIASLTLRQRPGPGNALGRLMFRMDREQEIFLHDTPGREVFRLDRRDLSSGCIRVADALGLARAVLDAEGRARLDADLKRQETVAIDVRRRVPVRTVYDTAWVDARGRAHFRDDIYGEDARVAATLPSTPPAGSVRSLTALSP
jgi:murein L,D-transpeptidase YcbB/YkuD